MKNLMVTRKSKYQFNVLNRKKKLTYRLRWKTRVNQIEREEANLKEQEKRQASIDFSF